MERQATQHSMDRRSSWKNYCMPGIYHVTMRVDDELAQPFGKVVGSCDAPADSPEAPHVALTPVGERVQHELLHAITAHYPMVQVQDYIIMPEHLHFIVQVTAPIISQNGKPTHLGQVIAGFKKGCNRHYWALTGQQPGAQAVFPPAGAASHQGKPDDTGGTDGTGGTEGRAPYKVPSKASSGRAALFHKGYCDVMPLRPGQLETQRAYIKENPRSRLLRTQNRAWMGIKRSGIDTALKPSALRAFLKRECPATACTDEVLAKLGEQLLVAPDGTIGCDTYGDRQLLERPLLPVVCHRRDSARFGQQKERCLEAARGGAVLVSARIAKGEQAIIDEAIALGFPVVLIPDNGFADRYHPSTERLALCATHRLLLVTPWRYHYHYADSAITVAVCKTMNCLAQALCRQKDTWWQT